VRRPVMSFARASVWAFVALTIPSLAAIHLGGLHAFMFLFRGIGVGYLVVYCVEKAAGARWSVSQRSRGAVIASWGCVVAIVACWM